MTYAEVMADIESEKLVVLDYFAEARRLHEAGDEEMSMLMGRRGIEAMCAIVRRLALLGLVLAA